MTAAYIALGSNLSDPPAQLQRAAGALARLEGATLIKASSVYRSRPLGPNDQPDYLNAVVLLETGSAPLDLLDAMQGIEHAQGRERSQHWGPRTLDLDLLLYGDSELDSERLTLPHPRMHERDFVLRPLREVCARNLVLPNGDDLDTLLRACPDNDLVKTQCTLLTS